MEKVGVKGGGPGLGFGYGTPPLSYSRVPNLPGVPRRANRNILRYYFMIIQQINVNKKNKAFILVSLSLSIKYSSE